jgi:hypothetical protein
MSDDRLDEIERRLDRLERLAFLAFQDVRDVAEYAYDIALREPEDIKRLSYDQRNFKRLTDEEAVRYSELAVHELAALKKTMRLFRKQARLDILGVLRDLARGARRERLKKAA